MASQRRQDAAFQSFLRASSGISAGKRPVGASPVISNNDDTPKPSAGKKRINDIIYETLEQFFQTSNNNGLPSAGKLPFNNYVELQGQGLPSAGKLPVTTDAQVAKLIKDVNEEKYFKRLPSAGKKHFDNTLTLDEKGLPSAGKLPFDTSALVSGMTSSGVTTKQPQKQDTSLLYLEQYAKTTSNVGAGKLPIDNTASFEQYAKTTNNVMPSKRPIDVSEIGNERMQVALKALSNATTTGNQIYFVTNNLNGGEISPEMLGRIDQPRYNTGCEQLENMVCIPQGGIKKRPGLAHIGTSADGARIIPFVFSNSKALILEFHPAPSGEESYFYVWKDSTKIATGVRLPYTKQELQTIKYTQSADVIYLACSTKAPAKLMHYADNNWEFRYIDFKPSISKPTGIELKAGGESSDTTEVWYDYVVTAVDENGEEGEASVWTESNHIKTKRLSSSWNITISWSPVEGATEYRVYKKSSGVFGFIGRVENTWTSETIAQQEADRDSKYNTWQGLIETKRVILSQLQEVSGRFNSECVTQTEDGAIVVRGTEECQNLNNQKVDLQNQYDAMDGKIEAAKAAYEAVENETYGPHFIDTNIEADTADTPPTYDEPFRTDYPSVVFLHQQRLGWASTKKKPLTIWLSSTGMYERMAYSIPPKDDDRIEVTLAASRVNKIVWCESDRDSLSVGTEGNEWILRGSEGKALTPSDLSFQLQTSHGSQDMRNPAIHAGGNLLFLQRGGRVMRSFQYNFSNDKYLASDVTLLSRHIFEKASLVAWAWQAEPYSICWCVLSNGLFAGFTYMEDQQVCAWHRHETNGVVYDVACIPSESGEDEVYFLVKRVVNGEYVYSLEKMRSFYADVVTEEGFDQYTFTDGRTHMNYEGYCVPCLPEGTMQNGSTFLHVRKINALKCRCIKSSPFHARVGASEILTVPIRAGALNTFDKIKEKYHLRHVDWALPLGSGWRENDRLQLIFDGASPATVVGIVTTVEVAELAGSPSRGV